jgi:hypothetical protein
LREHALEFDTCAIGGIHAAYQTLYLTGWENAAHH